MMDAEALFCTFRRTGDPACLGQVFDLCADDLFAVSLHLCHDRAAAEDVLQATFVVAIERAAHYAEGRPLRPWLLGILHREAKRAARRWRRVPDRRRLLARGEVTPPQHVLAAEAAAAVRQALLAVPQPYREVVELHLLLQAFVSLQRNDAGPFERAWQGSTDMAGWIELTEVIPGMFRVYARPSQRSEQAPAEGEVQVRSGQASELQLRLSQ